MKMKSKNTFENMTKKEKKDFLSNDLSERIIRVEQRISARFGKMVPYDNTEYYKSMTETQRKKFDKYLENKGKKKLLRLFIYFLPFLFLFMVNFKFTGNVVNENFGNVIVVDYLMYGLILFFIFLLMVSVYRKKVRNKKFEIYFNPIEDIILKKNRFKK